MRILWVKIGGLWPLDVGGRLRSYHIVSELSKRHEVTVLTTHPPNEDGGTLAAHLPHARVRSFPYASPKAGSARFALALARSWFSALPVDLLKCRVPELRAEVERVLTEEAADVCVADFMFGAVNVPFRHTPVVLFEHNVEYMIWKRLAEVETRPWRRALLEIEWRKFHRAERRACRRSRSVVTVSALDRDTLLAGTPPARITSVCTGVDIAYFTRNGVPEKRAHLVFTGAMDWYPNENAMLYFIEEILPAIRSEIPQVTFTAAGRNPSAPLKAAAAAAGVEVTGTVADVRPYIDAAAVYVVPLRVGSGTRLKIFEALSMGKAVVSTGVGAEGLPLIDGEHYVRADDPRDFSRAVVALLRDPDRRAALGTAGGNLVRSRFSWAAVAREFEAACDEALR